MNTTDFFSTVESLFHDWNYNHPRILYSLIRALKPKVVFEIGTYRGYAACYMAQALKENGSGHLYCIDNFTLLDHVEKYGDPVQHWINNLTACDVKSCASLVVGDSTKLLLHGSVDFAYIDGWHSYKAAKHDFEMCAEKGATCICLDDTLNCIGPRKLVAELSREHWDVITLPNDNGLSICHRKVERRVTFSQELPGSPGTVLTNATDREIIAHLDAASELNNVDYLRFLITTAPIAKA